MNLVQREHLEPWYNYIIDFGGKESKFNSKKLFDIYSIVHLMGTACATKLGIKIFGQNIYVPITVFILSFIFELVENTPEIIHKYRKSEIISSGSSSYTGDSHLNIFGDMIFNTIGIFIGYYFSDGLFLIVLSLLFIIVTMVVGKSVWIDPIRTFLSDV